MSYSGSTLLSGLFNWLGPRVIGMGETHWILDKPEWSQCLACGPTCQVLYRLNRDGLCDQNLYDRVREAAGADVLVSSDKAPVLLSRFLQRHEADLIFLFKSPYAMAASSKHHQQDTIPAAFNTEWWVQWHEDALRWAASFGRSVVTVEYEKLASDPAGTFARLCANLALEAPPAEITFPPPIWHNISGNAGTWQNIRYAQKSIVLDDRWKTELTAAEQQEITGSAACMNTWRALQHRAI